MKHTLMILGVASFAMTATAGSYFNEIEDNNTLALANDIGDFSAPGGGVTLNGYISEGDVDWYSFTLNDTASLSFFAAFSAGNGDGVMQIADAGGTVIAFDDDSGVGLMPAIQIENLAAGNYYIGFSGFGDADSSSVGTTDVLDGGGHSEDFGYKISVGFTVIPAPGSMALLGLGGLVMTKRRRG